MFAFVSLLCFVCLGICGATNNTTAFTNDTGRIFHGSIVPSNEFNFMAAVFWADGGLCTGTILNDDSILTAAHCIVDTRDHVTKRSWVLVGHKSISMRERDRDFVYPVSHFFMMDDHLDQAKGNDVLVIKLARKIKFGPRVTKVCLPEKRGVNARFEKCMAVGWGDTEDDGRNQVLRQVNLPYIPTPNMAKTCKSKYKINQKNVLCAYDAANPKRGTCFGDSGGPLLCPSLKDEWLQYGIDMFSPQQCGQDGPEFYTRVAAHIAWIRKKAES